jgi:hypothetical protein
MATVVGLASEAALRRDVDRGIGRCKRDFRGPSRQPNTVSKRSAPVIAPAKHPYGVRSVSRIVFGLTPAWGVSPSSRACCRANASRIWRRKRPADARFRRAWAVIAASSRWPSSSSGSMSGFTFRDSGRWRSRQTSSGLAAASRRYAAPTFGRPTSRNSRARAPTRGPARRFRCAAWRPCPRPSP